MGIYDIIIAVAIISFISYIILSKKKSPPLEIQLSILYDEICLVSERMRNCNSPFIQTLNEMLEENKDYKIFKISVIASCMPYIEQETIIKRIKELDKLIKEEGNKVRQAMKKYDDGKDFWESLREKASEKRNMEILLAFWAEHFSTAQRYLLSSWTAKQRNESAYMLRGGEKI